MGFERFSPESIDYKREHREVLSPAIEKVHAASKELFAKKQYVISMDEFADIYTLEKIAKNKQYAAQLERHNIL